MIADMGVLSRQQAAVCIERGEGAVDVRRQLACIQCLPTTAATSLCACYQLYVHMLHSFWCGGCAVLCPKQLAWWKRWGTFGVLFPVLENMQFCEWLQIVVQAVCPVRVTLAAV
jgi:hypothetical protein